MSIYIYFILFLIISREGGLNHLNFKYDSVLLHTFSIVIKRNKKQEVVRKITKGISNSNLHILFNY